MRAFSRRRFGPCCERKIGLDKTLKDLEMSDRWRSASYRGACLRQGSYCPQNRASIIRPPMKETIWTCAEARKPRSLERTGSIAIGTSTRQAHLRADDRNRPLRCAAGRSRNSHWNEDRRKTTAKVRRFDTLEVSGHHMWLSTRDMARLGYLMLRQGRSEGSSAHTGRVGTTVNLHHDSDGADAPG